MTLLLAHSWANLGGVSPLEVVVVGPAPSELVGRLLEIGVEVTPSPPHPLDPVSRFSNKLLGLRQSEDGAVLLVDNDICFLEDIFDLEGRTIRASFNLRPLISDAQWERIAAETGLKPLEMQWIPPREELKAKWAGQEPMSIEQLYLNTGVVWVREPAAFATTWAAHTAAIARAFDGHQLDTHWVNGDDQAGFSTAAAEHGGFDLLPFTYNCRPGCIRAGLTQPKILHLVRFGKTPKGRFSEIFTEYWDRRILRRIRRERRRWPLPGAENDPERLLDEATELRDRVLDLGAEAGLDSI